MIRRLSSIPLTLTAVITLGGCGAIIQKTIDTQPRVHVEDHALENPSQIVHGLPVAYEPANTFAGCDQDLARYSPILVQGFQTDRDHPDYDDLSDAIGMPTCTADGQTIHVNTLAPVVFGRVEHAGVFGTTLKQLTYVFWYPRRDVGSIETGEVDGGILRVTLDSAGNPAVFEFSQTCGCYHGVFAASHTEEQAQEEYGPPQAPRKRALETSSDASEWIIRDVIDAAPNQKPVLYISAGDHMCELMRFTADGSSLNVSEVRHYAMQPYDNLERIPTDAGGTVSMFNEQKLVRGARRWKEELVFSNIDHPGWPRHLDVMMIHWDHDRWNDPMLLEHHLRMPHAAVAPATGVSPSPQTTAQANH